MQALLEQGGYDMPQRGDIREGTVLSITPQEIIIDLGLKREGIVPANDLSRLDPEMVAEVQEGTVWPVYILQPSDRDGNLIVSLSRAIQEKDWLVAQQMMESGEIFEATVSGHNAGGLEVVFGKLRGFVPASHVSTLPRNAGEDERRDLLAAYAGQTIPVKVVEVDRRRRRLIMSERAAHRRWQREHRKQLLDEIEVGEVRTGIVRSLANFGAFVDLGGADGLIHISELAWFPVNHPGDVVKVGDKIEVKVLRVDKSKERVGLSLKRVQPDPWSHVEEDYKTSELVEAVVTRVTDFGAFVRLRSGVEGLLHVTEMADIRPDHPQSLVSPGDLLLLRVIRIEPQRRRIGLSLRQVSESEWASWAASYREKFTPEAEEEHEAEGIEVKAEAEEMVAIASEELAAEEAVGELVAEEVEAEASEAVAAVDVGAASEEAVIQETVDEGVAIAAEEAVIEETFSESQIETTDEETLGGEAAVDDEASGALVLVSDEPDSPVLVEESPNSQEEDAQPPASEDTSPEVTGDEKHNETDSDGDDDKE
jgi:small subunit ribosomal protein S1